MMNKCDKKNARVKILSSLTFGVTTLYSYFDIVTGTCFFPIAQSPFLFPINHYGMSMTRHFRYDIWWCDRM